MFKPKLRNNLYFLNHPTDKNVKPNVTYHLREVPKLMLRRRQLTINKSKQVYNMGLLTFTEDGIRYH